MTDTLVCATPWQAGERPCWSPYGGVKPLIFMRNLAVRGNYVDCSQSDYAEQWVCTLRGRGDTMVAAEQTRRDRSMPFSPRDRRATSYSGPASSTPDSLGAVDRRPPLAGVVAEQRGAILPIMALLLVVLLGVVGFAVDLG